MTIKTCAYCTKEYATRQTRKHGVPYKQALAGCKLIFCNPTCDKTSFGSKPLSKRLQKQRLYKRGQTWRAEFEKRRGSKRAVLKDGFYVGLTKKNVDSLKKQGALSGCYE